MNHPTTLSATEECPIPPAFGGDVDQLQKKWNELCVVLNNVRFHEMRQAWHRQQVNDELQRAAKRWNLCYDDGPLSILRQLEDLLLAISLRLHRDRTADAAGAAGTTGGEQ